MIATVRIIAVSIVLSACAGPQPPLSVSADKPAAPVVATRKLTDAEKVTLGKMLAGTLKDPTSAQWKWSPYPVATEGTVHYCAQVNAKNSYGGYNGFQPFMAVIGMTKGKFLAGSIAGIEDGRSSPGNPFTVTVMCKEKGLDPYAPG